MALFVLYNEVSLSQGLTRGKRMRNSHSCTFVIHSNKICEQIHSYNDEYNDY